MYEQSIASTISCQTPRVSTSGSIRGLAAMRAISRVWATPTCPAASALFHTVTARRSRASCTLPCASEPESCRWCFIHALAVKYPISRNGAAASRWSATAMAAAWV